jgi:hypothetical protein
MRPASPMKHLSYMLSAFRRKPNAYYTCNTCGLLVCTCIQQAKGSACHRVRVVVATSNANCVPNANLCFPCVLWWMIMPETTWSADIRVYIEWLWFVLTAGVSCYVILGVCSTSVSRLAYKHGLALLTTGYRLQRSHTSRF